MDMISHDDPPSWYFPMAWDLFLTYDTRNLDELTTEALRGYDAHTLIRAMALTAIPMIVAMREFGGEEEFAKLVRDHIQAIHEALSPLEIHLP